MINSRQDLKEYIQYEMSKYDLGGVRYVAKLLLASENAIIWKFQKRLRVTEYHHNCDHKFRYALSLARLNRMRNKYGFNISLNVFGKGLKIMHIGPILTNGNVRVGEDCSIHINTALVAQGVTDGVPNVGANVVIGVGATLLGDITIADGIAVGAGAVVNKSFDEPGIAIAGVPARKVSENGRSRWNKVKIEMEG